MSLYKEENAAAARLKEAKLYYHISELEAFAVCVLIPKIQDLEDATERTLPVLFLGFIP